MAEQAGDRRSLDNVASKHDFTYPLMMEAQIRRLKLSLENWREVVLPIKSVFLWEKHWHPTALLGASTVCFTLLWLLDPSILTIFSLIGLCITVCDYFIPSFASTFFKPEKWTPKKEKEFEDLCTHLVIFKAKTELAIASYYRLRSNNRKTYFISTVTLLSFLAWIGCTFNNLFLAYLLTTFVLLFPGMEHNGMISKWSSGTQRLVSDLLNQAKARVGHEKKEN